MVKKKSSVKPLKSKKPVKSQKTQIKKSASASKKVSKKILNKSTKKAPSKTLKKTTQKAAKKTSKKVLAVPKGYRSVTPYLAIKNADAAITFYKKVFGAKEKFRMQDKGSKVCHAELDIGDAKIMLADQCPEMDFHAPHKFGGTPVAIHLYMKDVDTIVSKALSLGAKLTRPVQDMFWGDRCGSFEDPYGHRWFVSTHIEDITPSQMKKRMAELGE